MGTVLAVVRDARLDLVEEVHHFLVDRAQPYTLRCEDGR